LQPRARLAESLSAADVHLVSLLPRLETCSVPSKLYGILAAGRPVLFVGDPDGEVARTIREADCGVAIKIGDVDGLAAAIDRLAAFLPRRRAMAWRARKAFETEFSEAAGADNWHRLLVGLRSDRPHPAAGPETATPGRANAG
jgi:glycosyltransferase involved in cell wall biosynthesis